MAITNSDGMKLYSRPEKAAILMLALGEEQAGKVMGLMDNDEIRDISQVMATLGTIPAGVVEEVLFDFVSEISSIGTLNGSVETTERFLSRALGRDRVGSILEDIRGPAGRTMWDKLGNVSEIVLANYLKNEYPQTVAVILSKIKSDHAARVLAQLPDSFAMEVIMRVLRMESVQKEVLDEVERTLRTEFFSNLARTNRRDAHEMIAEIFNNLDRATEARFITALEERSQESAARIKKLMFTFDDLIRIDGGGLQAVLRGADKAKVPIALKGASDAVRQFFFNNMSERAVKMLKEEMQAMGPVRLRDVEEAQAHIVNLAKELAAAGEVQIASDKGDDELVY